MNGLRSLRESMFPFDLKGRTRRFHGRRGITPIKSKKKRIIKTRSQRRFLAEAEPQNSGILSANRVENVSIQQHTSARSGEERSSHDEKEHSEHQGEERDQGSGDHGKREDTQKCQEADKCGNGEDSEFTVHPGSFQGVPRLSEHADTVKANETELKTEGSPIND